MNDPKARNDEFALYMQNNWPADGEPPTDAVDYIATEEGVDFLDGGIYRFQTVTVEDFLENPEMAEVWGELRRPLEDDFNLVRSHKV